MKYYSPTTNGFYDSNDFYLYEAAGTMPTDLVEITEDKYIELRSDIEAGRQIEPDDVGMPISYEPEMTQEQVKSLVDSKISRLLLEASTKIAPLQDAVDLGMATDAETASLTAWKTYRVLVNRVPTQPGFPTAIDWPSMPE